MLWILTLVYFQSMGDYWLCHVRPDLTGRFAEAEGIDLGIADLFHATVGMDTVAWLMAAWERLCLPI